MKLYVKTLSDESKVIEVTKGKLTKVKVSDGSKYQFIDDIKTKSKKNKLLKTKRVGDDLEVYFEGDTEPSLVLENYFVQMQTPPMIYNENGELLSQSGFINLTSDVDPFFLLATTDNSLLYSGLAVVAGGGIIALASNGGGSSNSTNPTNPTNPTDPTDVTPPSLNTNTGVTSTGTPTDGINIVTTLPSNVVVGDKVTTVLKDSNGTVIQTLETVVTANDIQTGTITQEVGVLPFGTYTTFTSMVDAAGNVSGIAEIPFNNNLSGQLQDDYIADAFVFIDSNNNGIWDEGEEWTQTDSNGRFEFKTNPNGAPIVAMGGVDTASGTPNTISYKMYLDATTQQVGGDVIMSPLSTLIAAIADAQAQANGNQEITQESLIAAVNTIGQVFGIDIQDPVAILNYDFVASSTGENATAFDKDFLSLNRQIAVVLSTTTALIDGAAATTNSDVDANILGKGTLVVTQSIANLILEKSSSESIMDLTSLTDIRDIIENSMTISNESELTSDLRASDKADLTTLSEIIAGFNTKIDEQTNLDPQSSDAKATIRTVTEVLIPILTTSGSQAQTERGGDISLSDSLTGLTTDASVDVNTYITNQIEIVKTENKPFLANDVDGITGQLTKIVLQMPTLGVGDSVDKLYISKETDDDYSVQLFTVNPLTKETNELTQEIEIDGRTYLVIDPAVVGFLYVKSNEEIELDYLDVIAYNTVNSTETLYSGDVKISMTNPLVLPTITITNMEDNAPAITGTISKNGVTNDSTPTMSGTLSSAIPDGYSLKVFNNDGNLTEVTPLEGLNWSYTSSSLDDGNYALSIAIVRDSDSKIMIALNPYGFIVDTATATPIINQTDGKVINGTAEIGSTVTVKDSQDNIIGTAMTDSNGKWSLTVSSQVSDETSLTASAVDRAGNSATSSSITVQWGVPTTLVTITKVQDDAKTLTNDSYTSDSTPTISGTISELLKENEVVSIFNGETKIGEAIVTGQTWTFTPTTPLIDGTYPLSAKVDNGAEQGVTSSVFTLNIDTVAPTQTIEITSVMDDISGIKGDIFDTNLTNDSKPTFNGTISSGLNSNESIVAYIGTTKVGVAKVTGTNWTFTPSTALSDGLKNIKFVVEDKSGLKSAITSFEFTIDTVAPSSIIIDSNSLITSIQEGDTETIICSVTATNGAILSMKSGSADSDLFEVSSDGKVTAKNGLDYESKGTYTFTIIATDEVGNSKELTATIAVTDATEAPKIISVEPSSLANYETSVEGETVEVSFIVKRTDSTGTATVSWETSGISAQDFENGELPSGEVTFANGETSKTVTILVPASLTQEQLRTLEISLVDASEGYYIDETNSSSTADIVDSSSVETGTRFTVLADNSVISEGAEGETKDITYTIVRSGDLSQSLTISYSITPSGAALVSGDDFGLQNLPSGNIIFEAGSDTSTVTISVKGDNDVGPDEQFNFLLGNLPDNSKVFGNTIGKIVNDDAYISVIPQEIVGATTGEVTHKFIIIRSGDISTSHSVTYTISSVGENGTDLFNTDEEVTITFEEGETQKEVSFQTTGDEVINGYKSFGIELFVNEDSNVTLLNKTAISTINPNVQDVKIVADIDRLLEGSSEEFIYTVTRSGNISEALEIPWSLEPSNENGVNASDFINNIYPSGTLVFAAGETTATIQFQSKQDTILEGDQGFNIVLDNASLPEYIRLINPSIEGVIVDDESAVGFATNAQFKAIEGDNGTTDLVITVTRVGFTGNASTVDWALSFGNEENSATLADLMQNQATSGTVTFKPGEATATITIKVAGDVDFEDGLNEVFDVTLSNPSAGTKLIGGTGENGVTFDGYSNTTTATIINDDSLIKVESSTVDYIEGHGGTNDYVAITILREGSTAGSDWVKWSLTSNGDSNSADNTDLGQENDSIGIFDSYYDSWIDFATLSGNQNAQGSVILSKDGYLMISYNRDWSYDNGTTPIDEFILNNLTVNGGILTSVENSSSFDLQYAENTITASGNANDDGENYSYTSYVIFKLDVTGANAEISFDMEQLGRYGIDTSAISYAPQGTFSVNKDDMKYENEGSNLLIPALTSPLLINVLGIDGFTNENYYSIEDVQYFNISSVYSDNLYFNEGTQENPNWVYFWDHTYNVESSYVSIQDINDGKIGYTGSTVELYVYAYDAEYSELSGTNIYTGVYTTLSIDDFAGDYDINLAEYVYFDSIPSENFYINISETSTPNWVNVYDNEGYVSVQDIIDGKLAYLGNSKDFEAYIYDNDENELSYIENIQYHILSVRELATDNDEGEWYTGYDVGADQIRIRNVYEGTLYYNNGTSENPEWIEYWDYVNNYNYSQYFPIQDAIDGKFAYSGEYVELRTYFYTDGDYESSIYPYIQASGGSTASEIATQTGEVALDGSGYIWVRYDNNDNSGNDGADQAWINNLHLIDPSGLATIEVVGQKVIKDGVAHEQELSSESSTLNLDGIAVNDSVAIFDTPSQITFSSDDNLTSRVFTITGTNEAGQTIVENVTGANGGITLSSQKFMTVTSITVDEGTVGSVKVGFTTSGGLTDNFVVTGSGTAEDPFVGYSTNKEEGTESDILLFVNFNGASAGSVKLSYDLAVQGSVNEDTLYVEYSSNILSLLQGKTYFEDGDSETTILIPVLGDDTKEADENMTLTLTGSSTGTTIVDDEKTTEITIVNDDDLVTLDSTPVLLKEGDDSQTPNTLRFKVTRDASNTEKEVFWHIENITSEDNDFAAISGSVIFEEGEFETYIDVVLTSDRIQEDTESFNLVLTTPEIGSGYSLSGSSTALGTIVEDDVAIRIVANDMSKVEGATDVETTYTFTVTRSGDTTQASSIVWNVAGDVANIPYGFDVTTGTLNFAADEIEKTITIKTTGNNEMDGDRPFTVTLTNANGDTSDIKVATATSTMIEDDAINLSILSTEIKQIEATGVNKTFTYTITRPDAESSYEASYNWSVILESDGVNPVASAEDFANSTIPSGNIVFAAGSKTATVTFEVASDSLLEADEAFKLRFEAANATQVEAQDIKAYIVNDTVAYSIEIKADDVAVDTAVKEGDIENKTITVTFVRAGNSESEATLTYSIEGTTTNVITANDFVGMATLPTNETITFAAGQSTVTKTFTLKADSVKEENESFKVVLKDGETEVATKTVEVTNDDAGLVLQVSQGEITEGTHAANASADAQYTTLTYTVFRSGDTTHSSTVSWKVNAESGITIDDFVGATDSLGTNNGLPSGTITFAANDLATSKTFTINVKKDWKYEGASENLVVELFDASAGTGITTGTVTTTILDDDKEVGFSVSTISQTVTEGSPAGTEMVNGTEYVDITYTVVRTGNYRDGTQNITWTLSGLDKEGYDSASVDWWYAYNQQWQNEDVTGWVDGSRATTGTLVFSGNEDNSKTITIRVHKDHYQENPEAFKITLSNPTEGLSVSETAGVAEGLITDDDIALSLSSESATRVVKSEGQPDAEGNNVYTEYTWVIERTGLAAEIDLTWSVQGWSGLNATYSDRYSNDGFGWWSSTVPSATANTSDFVEGYLTNTIHFNANETSKTLTIRVVGDAEVESTEAFKVVFTKPSNVGDISGLGNWYVGNPTTSDVEGIILRDEGRFGIESYELDTNSVESFDDEEYDYIYSDNAKSEGDTGYVSHFFKIYRDFTTSGDATIEWRVENGWVNSVEDDYPFLDHNTSTSADVNDFVDGQNTLANTTLPSGIATIADGEEYTIIEIKTKGDLTAEDLNSFVVRLSNPSSGSTLDGYNTTSMGYIANDDHPLFSIGLIVPDEDVSATYGSKVVTEGDTVIYRVYRSGSTAYEADIDWAVTFPNAVSSALNSDYKADSSDFDTSVLTGTLNFGVGESCKEITLNIKDDSLKEAWAEAFSIELSNARWAENVPQNIKDAKTPAISEVAGKMESIIVDNEEAASVVSVSAVNNATGGYEGGLGGTNTITYTLTRTGDTTTAAQIGWTLRTPSDLGDYVSIDGDTNEATYTPPNSAGVSYAVGLVSFEAGQETKTITLTYSNDSVVEYNENFVFTLIDGKTILETNWDEWMAPCYYGTGDDTTSNTNKSGVYLLDAIGRIPDSNNMYVDSEHSSVTTEVKNDDGKIVINNTYYNYGTQMGEHIYEGDSGNIVFKADISRHGRIDHNVTVDYKLLASDNSVVYEGTWQLDGDNTNTNGNGSINYTKEFVLGTGNNTVEANQTYTLKLSNVSDSNILFNQNINWPEGTTTQDVPVTVLNDDTTWSMTPGTLSQSESDDFRIYTFTITRPNNEYMGSATVTYQIIANNATYTIDTNDIVGGTGERTVSFAAGETSQLVTFRVAGDTLAERNESFNVELVSANHGVISQSNNKATYTIVNDDTTVEILNATSKYEGDADGAYLEFDVVRKGQISNGSSSVTWTVQDGSATISDDLTADPTTGSLSFDNAQTKVTTTVVDGYGEQTEKVRVNIKGDTTVEPHQSLSVSLSNATDSDGIATGKGIATGTILNDESIFTLTAGESVVEGDVIGQKFTITRSAVTGQPQTIDWAVSSEGNSHSVSSDDMDGGLLTGSVIFAPDELVKEIFVKSTVDTVAELDEVFKFTISVANGTTGATIAANSDVAYGKVLNDDAGTPVVSSNDSTIAIVANSSVVEGDTATSYVAFTLTRDGVLNYDAKVSWHIELIGDEANLADFGGTLPSGTLELPLGETTFTIQVPIIGDSTYEANEKFKLVIDNPEAGLEITVDKNTAEGTITNDDALISIVDNVVINENGTATFTLSRTGVLTESNTVTWTITPSGNVLGTNDISNLTGTATFAADSATTTVTVYLNDDSISEANEIFDFTLSNPSEGASLDVDNSTKTLTITNDDADKITYTVTPLSQVEGDDDGWTTYSVIVSRENPTTTVSVGWSVTETTALNLSDIIFEAQTGTVTFEGTSLTATFDIKVKTDDIGDFDKYFDLNLSNPIVKINDVVDSVNGAYVDTNTTELEVLNDDPAFRVDFTANSFVEGNGTNTKLVTFTITRSGDLSGTASLDWAISTDENSENPVNISDFGGYWPSGTTVFADGESAKTIQVAIAPDAVFEPSENFTVEISNLVSQTQGAQIIVATDTAVIANDDIGVSVEASVDSINEGTGKENTNVTFTLSAQGVANKTVTTYFVIEGTDLSPIDEFDGKVNMDSFLSKYGNSDYFSYGYDEEKQSFYVQMKTDSDGYAESTFDYGIFADNIAGANETLRVRITEVVGGTADNSETTVEIINDDTAITSIVNTTVDVKEGNDGTKTYTFEVTRSGSTISSAQVAYKILGFGDNQADNSDFEGQLPSSIITFAEGSSTAIIEVVVSSDTVFESDEGFIVVVAPSTPNEARLEALIKNDDLATLEVNGIVTSVKEGTDNSNFLTYEIVRNGDNSEPLTVHYKLVDLDNNDIETADYLVGGATGTITIPAGESRVILSLETVNDEISGNDIEFKLQISAEGFVNPTAVNSKIVDDDSGISIVAPEIVANQDGTITYTFEVNRTGNLAATTVAWTLAGLGINAAASNDFTTEMAGNVVFAENDTTKQIVITVAADSIVENDENFRITLVSSTDTTQKILVSSADAIIEDDDVISVNADSIQGGAGVDVIDSLGGDDIIHSGNGADVIHAGNGNDTIYTESGADTVYAGAGDDNIVVDSLDFMLVDGGLGFDTLTLAGADMVLDFASITAGEKVKSIEAIDLTGNGDNTLKLSFDDVFALNDSKELYINGDSGDKVEIDLTGTTTSTQEINGTTYNVYEYNAEDEYAKILVEQTVTINLI